MFRGEHVSFSEDTLPETNIAPKNRPFQTETIVFQPSIFRCDMLVFWDLGAVDLNISETLWIQGKRGSWSSNVLTNIPGADFAAGVLKRRS